MKVTFSTVHLASVFGGYPSFNRIKYLKKLRKCPAWLFQLANQFTSDRYKKVSFLQYEHPLADYLMLRGLYTPSDIAKILDTDLHHVEDALFNNKSLGRIRNYDELDAAFFELNLYMQNQLLRDTDVMGMSHGLEIRVPFLDEDFQKAVDNISPEIRFNSHQPKKLLIDSFQDLLPEAIWNRSKMGFSFPLQQWMKAYPEINDENLYRGKKMKRVVKAFKNNEMHWSKAFALYQIRTHA